MAPKQEAKSHAKRIHDDVEDTPEDHPATEQSSKRVKASPLDMKLQTRSTRASKTSATESVGNAESSSATKPATLKVTELTGDIFDAPDNTLIIHACNCQGSWGAGIAKAFAENYPDAYPIYVNECEETGDDLVGKALLIPPQRTADKFVGCLFTSRSMGRYKDSPTAILKATGPAMRDLLKQVREWNAEQSRAERKVRKLIEPDRNPNEGPNASTTSVIGEVRMCQINSGLFNVPWEKTKAVLEGIKVYKDDVKEVKVISPA